VNVSKGQADVHAGLEVAFFYYYYYYYFFR
jgi:hypothetical protein